MLQLADQRQHRPDRILGAAGRRSRCERADRRRVQVGQHNLRDRVAQLYADRKAGVWVELEQDRRATTAGLASANRPNKAPRGQMIDEPALIEALQAGKIAGAGLDVAVKEPLPQDHPFWTLPNVLITPHIGGAGGPGHSDGFTKIFIDNLRRWVDNKPLVKVVIERTA